MGSSSAWSGGTIATAMAMGHEDDEQDELFVAHAGLRKGGGHPFNEALDKVRRANGFDAFVEGLCEPFYKEGAGREFHWV